MAAKKVAPKAKAKPASKVAAKPKAVEKPAAVKPAASEKPIKVVEPTFTLRGQDAFAPEIVRKWAEEFKRKNTSGHGDFLTKKAQAKYDGALKIADAMAAWPGRRNPD